MALNEKMGRVSDAEEPALVGVEGSWPVLFRTSGVLGFVLLRRRPSGHYEPSWPRLLPMAGIVAAMGWHLFTFPFSFTDVAYDAFADVACYSLNAVHIAHAFGVAVYRRRETRQLLQGLEGTQEPAKAWVSVAGSLVVILHTALYFAINYLIVSWDSLNTFHWVCMTLIFPVLPLFFTLYLASLIHALAQVYRRTAKELGRGCSEGRAWASLALRLDKELPGLQELEDNDPSQSIYLRRSARDFNGVASIVIHCKKLSHLVNLYNQIFSGAIALTLLTFLANLLNSTYYTTISFGDWFMFYGGGLSYTVTEICFFYLLCGRADALRTAHGMVEEALLDLQQHPDTSSDDRNRLLSLSLHLRNRPAHISVGSMGGLSSSTLVVMVNAALTYTAILFQYRPTSSTDQ